MHKFKAINRTKLDNPKRREILPTKETLIKLGLKSDDIKNKINENNVRNITCVKTEEYNLKLEDEAVTFAIMVNVLHEIEDKIKMLKEIKRILKLGGKIVIIDFEKKETEEGPPVEHRIAKEELLDLYKTCGFEFVDGMSFSNTFYGLVATSI